MSNIVEWLKSDAKVTPEEEAKHGLILWWPNPGKMPKQTTNADRRALLERLDAWFYKELSAKSHLSLTGFAKGPAHLRLQKNVDQDKLKKHRSDGVFTTITLLLVLISEIEVEFAFGLAAQLKYLWKIVAEYWGAARELYDARYAGVL